MLTKGRGSDPVRLTTWDAGGVVVAIRDGSHAANAELARDALALLTATAAGLDAEADRIINETGSDAPALLVLVSILAVDMMWAMADHVDLPLSTLLTQSGIRSALL